MHVICMPSEAQAPLNMDDYRVISESEAHSYICIPHNVGFFFYHLLGDTKGDATSLDKHTYQ